MRINLKVSEGKSRLRILLAALAAIFMYVHLYRNYYGYYADPHAEQLFMEWPLKSLLAGVLVFSLVSAFYWVLEGFEKK